MPRAEWLKRCDVEWVARNGSGTSSHNKSCSESHRAQRYTLSDIRDATHIPSWRGYATGRPRVRVQRHVRFGITKHTTTDHLREDAAGGPQVDGRGVHLSAQQDLGRSVPQGHHLRPRRCWRTKYKTHTPTQPKRSTHQQPNLNHPSNATIGEQSAAGRGALYNTESPDAPVAPPSRQATALRGAARSQRNKGTIRRAQRAPPTSGVYVGPRGCTCGQGCRRLGPARSQPA